VAIKENPCATAAQMAALKLSHALWVDSFKAIAEDAATYNAAQLAVASAQSDLEAAQADEAEAAINVGLASTDAKRAQAQASLTVATRRVGRAKQNLAGKQAEVGYKAYYLRAGVEWARTWAASFAKDQAAALAAKCPATAALPMTTGPPAESAGATVSSTPGGAQGGVISGHVEDKPVVGPAVAPTPEPAKPNTKSGGDGETPGGG